MYFRDFEETYTLITATNTIGLGNTIDTLIEKTRLEMITARANGEREDENTHSSNLFALIRARKRII